MGVVRFQQPNRKLYVCVKIWRNKINMVSWWLVYSCIVFSLLSQVWIYYTYIIYIYISFLKNFVIFAAYHSPKPSLKFSLYSALHVKFSSKFLSNQVVILLHFWFSFWVQTMVKVTLRLWKCFERTRSFRWPKNDFFFLKQSFGL